MTRDGLIYGILLILLMAALTYGARLFPYLLFGRRDRAPAIIVYLGAVLPPAVMILLIVYCLRDIDPVRYPWGLPSFASIVSVFALYKLTKNNLIAMIAGTLIFMTLLRVL
jgi:branched-subunit amino acid transport protein AzlD